MLLTVVKGIKEVIYHSIYRYTIANKKYTKDYDKNKELDKIDRVVGNKTERFNYALSKLIVDNGLKDL